MSPAEAAAVLARLLQFSGAALLAGAPLFFLYGPAPEGRWPMRLVRWAALIGGLGALAWLMAQTALVEESGAAAFDPAKVWDVAGGTGFGRAALARAVLMFLGWAAALGAGSRGRWLLLAALGCLASASFAWSGHGSQDEGVAGALHQTADVLHLLASSVWVGALVCLSMLGWRAVRGAAGAGPDLAAGMSRFSDIGLGVVVVLGLSGLVNIWFVLAPRGLASIAATLYSQLLVAKLMVFALMLLLAAANRFRHTPALELARSAGALEAGSYRLATRSVLIETALAVLVLALVSWLGTLAPVAEPH
jgi:putative copper resistance protein D